MSMENIWRYSQPIDPETVRQTPSFTTLPVRVNTRQDVANAATTRALREWDAALQDGMAARALVSFSDLGNLGAFAYPEAEPEKLHILTYLTDMGMLHDDGYEAMDMDTARTEHRELGLLFDPNKPHQPSFNTRAPRIKKLVSQILLEATAIDRALAMYMFDMYNKGWLAVAGEAKEWHFNSVEEYQAYRRNDFGATALWAMTEFAVGIRLSDADRKLIKTVMEPIEKAVIWTNDYWSFDREYYEASVNGSRLVNLVEVIRRCENLSIDDAKARARELLIDTEQTYIRNKEELYANNPSMSLELKRWVEVVGAIVGGTHYWASSAPRHRTWAHEERNMTKSADELMLEIPEEHASSEESTTPDCFSVSSSSSQQTRETDPSDYESSSNQPLDVPKADNGPGSKQFSQPQRGGIEQNCEKQMESPQLFRGLLITFVGCLPKGFDCSPKRRGQPATHVLFGHSQAINSANYMFIQAVRATRSFHNPEAMDILLEELENLYLGQSWDLQWKYNLTCPSIDDYTNMIDNKTGGMFRLLLRLLQNEAGPGGGYGCDQAPGLSLLLDRLTTQFGRFFQIRDDYMNLRNSSYAQQKGCCEDLDEGKFSYPIVYCAAKYPDFKSPMTENISIKYAQPGLFSTIPDFWQMYGKRV
ncbi:hypothetical protein AN2611.2 [Aspergillus nidulans FGSC A4]|uniref:Geranylgeranyl diphosphate synthase, putative (JCVI) n=1 Tax=Emericella nidulans (strain FGSC A4 / ATCC 38163 / CBS 112.46 / NRRL 194 / M139) TaxID=227321 RepID=Q5BA19_EMENI|nr:hypothetical protein [Aspergillus nidulans FGSC A4]EAA64716.1 hypothetical protein AN2611.2 [Aspergillus nidulans FGSC A4]CBF87199.1 TPA: geranylgeranyl diphosphate synthase, putative (JCVI) [Aspergillus nidulans FGSC A4]|eukprot:XP_660215.1 hypothetical protein AN2611.2 [Aspergillus nidulans FGSC A4]